MNDPTGFRMVHGRVSDGHPLQAMFNPTWPTETTHMILAAILATAFGVAAVYAAGLLRGRRDPYQRWRWHWPLALAAGARRDRGAAGSRRRRSPRTDGRDPTFGTRMAAAGTPMRSLQHWMGYVDSKTTQIYAHYRPGDQEANAVGRAFA